ncbi:hypothetical protein N9O57_01650 [bacterium]|nr:hypothetical protein [bacterium]
MNDFNRHLENLREKPQYFEEAIFPVSRSWFFEKSKNLAKKKLIPAPIVEPTSKIASSPGPKAQEQQSVKEIAQTSTRAKSAKKSYCYELKNLYSKQELLSYFSNRFDSSDLKEHVELICTISVSKFIEGGLNSFYEEEIGGLFKKMNSSLCSDSKICPALLMSSEIHLIDFDESYAKAQAHEYDMFCSLVYHYRPKYIVSYGGVCTNFLARKKENLTSIHGKFLDFNFSFEGEKVSTSRFALFHPSLLFINPSIKQVAWKDMQLLIAKLKD